MAANFRTLFKHLVPRWLADESSGSRVLHAFALLIDASVERAYQGLLQRFPSYAGVEALRLIGGDRLIPRGRDEAPEHYAKRLIEWRGEYGHRTRGNAPALLHQVCEYFGGVACSIIDRGGNYDLMSASRVWSYETGYDWDWDGAPLENQWARFWIIVEFSGSWGWYDRLAIWKLLYSEHPWRPAGTQPEWMIIVPSGYPDPDGTWGTWSRQVGGHQYPSRDPTFAYVSLAPWYNNTYGGDPDLFCDDALLPGGAGLYAGDPDKFVVASDPGDVDAIVSPIDGIVFVGDPNNFLASIVLPDDGDLK